MVISYNFVTEASLFCCNWWEVLIGFDNDLVPNRWQTIIYTTNNAVQRRGIYALQGEMNQRNDADKMLEKFIMTSSDGNVFHVTGLFLRESTGHRLLPSQGWVTRGVDVFFDVRLNKRLSKQSRYWLFDTSRRSLWRHCYCKCQCWLLTLLMSRAYKPTSDRLMMVKSNWKKKPLNFMCLTY